MEVPPVFDFVLQLYSTPSGLLFQLCEKYYTLSQHTFFEAHLPVKGEQTYQFGNRFITVKPGEMILIAPKVNHSIPYSSADLDKYSITFSCSRLLHDEKYRWVYETLNSGEHFFFLSNAGICFESFFKMIFAQAASGTIAWHERVAQLSWCLVMSIASVILPDTLQAQYSDTVILNESMRRFEEAKQFILDNLALPLSCDFVASCMNLSIKQLDRDIRKVQNIGLHELIESLKLAEAKRLLKDKTIPIDEVGDKVGYSEKSSFSRFFKRKEGISPNAYRKML